MSTHRNERPLLPQEYYDSNQGMALLKLSKERYYELIERDEDPLPMRMFSWSTRGARAESHELRAWFMRNTMLARDKRRQRQ